MEQLDSNEGKTQCSVKSVCEVISQFDSVKRELVKSIGFGGLLQLPALTEMDRKLAVWLLRKVDVSSQSIVIDHNRIFAFSKVDVNLVFGIPAAGKRVMQSEPAPACSDSQVAYVRSCLGLTGKDSWFVKAAQEVLQRQYSTAMHPKEKASFKVAFVVFVMAMLLAPSPNHDHSRTDFWAALGRPNEIGSYDWSSYVIYHLLFAATKLKSDLTKNIASPLITGCIFFLQVLYLDSIDLGDLNMPHDSFPRAQWFTPDRIRAMVAEDTVRSPGGKINIEFGASVPRPSAEVCYTWGKISGRVQRNSIKKRLYDAAMHWVSTANISEEAATPIFFAMTQHQETIDDKIDELRVILLEVIGVIAKSYRNGFKYCSSIGGMRRATDGAEIPLNLCSNSRMEHTTFPPHFELHNPNGKDTTVPDASPSLKSFQSRDMMKESTPSSDLRFYHNSTRPTGLPLGSDVSSDFHPIHDLQTDNSLREAAQTQQNSSAHKKHLPATVNKVASEFHIWSNQSKSLATVVHSLERNSQFQETDSSIMKKKVSKCHSPPTPWQIGQKEGPTYNPASEFYQWMTTLQPRSAITVPWLTHFKPKFIQLARDDIHRQITAQAEFDFDFMDICIRRIKQMDDALYGAHNDSRWCHIMESDFMAVLLSEQRLMHSQSVRQQFLGDHLTYDIPSCRCIFFPAVLNQRWVCYVWDLAENKVVAYDPSMMEETSNNTVSMHIHVMKKLRDAMEACANFFFEGWTQSWSNPRLHFYKLSLRDPPPPKNRSGVYVAHFCRCFNGSSITPELSMETVGRSAAFLLYDAMKLSDNEGRLPDKFHELASRQNAVDGSTTI